jgi:hypothetical protein
MPGLLRGIGRTAMIAGTATAVSNRVSRRQANRWSQQEAPPEEAAPAEPAAPAPAAPDSEDRYAQLKQLGELKAQGVLTEQEFAAEKARVLGS